MNYKVGQRVRVRKDLKIDNVYGDLKLIKMMFALCGMTLTIKEITGEGFYRFVETNFTLSDAMIEGLADEPITTRPEPSRLEIAAMLMRGFISNGYGSVLNETMIAKKSLAHADALIKECNRTKQEVQS